MSEIRKLVAILVADVVGYSRLAGADEDRTLARLRALRSDLIDPTTAVHHGPHRQAHRRRQHHRVPQRGRRSALRDRSPERPGDGVNIAARLDGVAKPGAICLSEQAYWQVKGRLDLKVNDLGHTQLKNVAELKAAARAIRS
jgi:adenylate cyclase